MNYYTFLGKCKNSHQLYPLTNQWKNLWKKSWDNRQNNTRVIIVKINGEINVGLRRIDQILQNSSKQSFKKKKMLLAFLNEYLEISQMESPEKSLELQKRFLRSEKNIIRNLWNKSLKLSMEPLKFKAKKSYSGDHFHSNRYFGNLT